MKSIYYLTLLFFIGLNPAVKAELEFADIVGNYKLTGLDVSDPQEFIIKISPEGKVEMTEIERGQRQCKGHAFLGPRYLIINISCVHQEYGIAMEDVLLRADLFEVTNFNDFETRFDALLIGLADLSAGFMQMHFQKIMSNDE